MACIVVADYPDFNWSQSVLMSTQKTLLENGFVIAEMVPQFHRYHLDDTPDLTSCSLVGRRLSFQPGVYSSRPLEGESLENFYGDHSPLRAGYVRDLRRGSKLPSRDYKIEPLTNRGG